MVPEKVSKEVSYTVMVPQQKEETYSVTVYDTVAEEKTETYTVCVPRHVTKEVAVTVCRMVAVEEPVVSCGPAVICSPCEPVSCCQ
jgi:hypothetical protein